MHLKEALIRKQAGLKSEMYGSLNPIQLATNPIGLLISTMTKTRTKAEQREADKDKWKNVLIPGYGGYNIGKRMGRLANSREGQELLGEAVFTVPLEKEYERTGFGSPHRIVTNVMKHRGGEEPDPKKVARIVELLKERGKDVRDPYVVPKMFGTMMAVGPVLGSPVIMGMEAGSGERVLEWARKNPKKAAELRKLVRSLTSAKFEKRYKQE